MIDWWTALKITFFTFLFFPQFSNCGNFWPTLTTNLPVSEHICFCQNSLDRSYIKVVINLNSMITAQVCPGLFTIKSTLKCVVLLHIIISQMLHVFRECAPNAGTSPGAVGHDFNVHSLPLPRTWRYWPGLASTSMPWCLTWDPPSVSKCQTEFAKSQNFILSSIILPAFYPTVL